LLAVILLETPADINNFINIIVVDNQIKAVEIESNPYWRILCHREPPFINLVIQVYALPHITELNFNNLNSLHYNLPGFIAAMYSRFSLVMIIT